MTKLSKSAAIGATALLMSTSAMAMDVKISGFVDLDVHSTEFSAGSATSEALHRKMYRGTSTPTAAAGAGSSFEYFDYNVQDSRLRLSAKQGDVTGFFEIDFFGSNGNQVVSNSSNPRLRRAFIKTGNWLMGQEWTTFQNLSAIPASASFLVASDAQVFVRQQQIRYTNGALQVSIENPHGTGAASDDSSRPDVVVRYNNKGSYGNVSVSYLSRELADAGAANTTDGTGFNIAGRVNAGAGDVRFSYVSGEGLGRYIGVAAANDAQTIGGEMTALEGAGHVLALRYPLGGGNISIGNSAYEVDTDGATGFKESSSSYVAYLWNPKPKLTYGVEYLTGTTELQNGNEGDVDRMTFSAKYAF